MFNATINNPVSPLTRTYIENVTIPVNSPDYSLISLATALIKPRVGYAYKGIGGEYYYARNYEHVTQKIASFMQSRVHSEKSLIENVPAFYYILSSLTQDGMTAIRNFAKNENLVELTTIENFVNQQLGITEYGVFINEEYNVAFVIVGSSPMSLYHLSISFISLLFPKMFKNNPLNKEETEILKSLTNKSASNFIERISASLQYMKEDLLRQELSNCFRGFRQGRIDRCKMDLERLENEMENRMRNYRELVENYNAMLIQYEGLQVVNGDDRNEQEQETVDYLCSCPAIHEVNYDSGTLRFCADTLLTNFDVNKWQNVARRNNIYDSYRLPEGNAFRDKANRKLLFDNIFNNKPLLYVRMKGCVELMINRCDMIASRGQTEAENSVELVDYVSNPHFKLHGCPGRNREQIARCLRETDIISAIECSIAAIGSVNIDETEYTFRPFLQEILSSTNKIIQNAKGETMTPEEALLWLSKQKDEETV